MKLLTKTQEQEDLDNLVKRIDKVRLALSASVHALNLTYDSVWCLPDNRLQPLLQLLLDINKLEEVLSAHVKAASYINELLDLAEDNGIRAKIEQGREYIIENGTISLVPLPITENVNFQNVEEPILDS